jgi:hypothetical protein
LPPGAFSLSSFLAILAAMWRSRGAAAGFALAAATDYFLARGYPKAGQDTANADVFYYVTSEPMGTSLCDSAVGTGVNAPGRQPQPRYFDAAPGLGACQSWVCVSDKYPPVKASLPPE